MVTIERFFCATELENLRKRSEGDTVSISLSAEQVSSWGRPVSPARCLALHGALFHRWNWLETSAPAT